MFAFLYLKANSMEICDESSIYSFSQKNVGVLLKFKANYLQKNRGYPGFSLWNPIAIAKIYVFHVVLP